MLVCACALCCFCVCVCALFFAPFCNTVCTYVFVCVCVCVCVCVIIAWRNIKLTQSHFWPRRIHPCTKFYCYLVIFEEEQLFFFDPSHKSHALKVDPLICCSQSHCCFGRWCIAGGPERLICMWWENKKAVIQQFCYHVVIKIRLNSPLEVELLSCWTAFFWCVHCSLSSVFILWLSARFT